MASTKQKNSPKGGVVRSVKVEGPCASIW